MSVEQHMRMEERGQLFFLEFHNTEDDMKHFKTKIRMAFLFLMCLGFVSAVLMPGAALATATSTGTAFIDWSTLNITLGGTAFDPTLNFDPVWGSQSAMSGAQVQLNANQTDFGTSADYSNVNAPTTALAPDPFFDPNFNPNANGSSVTAQGSTSATAGMTTGLSASLTMKLNSPDSSGIGPDIGYPPKPPNQAQATFYDFGFIAPSTGGTFMATVDYALNNSIASTDPYVVASDVFAGLFLFGYDADGNPVNDPLTSATDELYATLAGIGDTGLLSKKGTLTLAYDLIGGILYDFGGEVTATGSAAPVPEPATMLLLGSGLLGLGAFRKRIHL